jgi:hypothetical protein
MIKKAAKDTAKVMLFYGIGYFITRLLTEKYAPTPSRK